MVHTNAQMRKCTNRTMRWKPEKYNNQPIAAAGCGGGEDNDGDSDRR